MDGSPSPSPYYLPNQEVKGSLHQDDIDYLPDLTMPFALFTVEALFDLLLNLTDLQPSYIYRIASVYVHRHIQNKIGWLTSYMYIICILKYFWLLFILKL